MDQFERNLYKANILIDSTLEDNIICPYCGCEINALIVGKILDTIQMS